MRVAVSLLLIASVALPSVAQAKTTKPRPTRAMRAAQHATHANGLLGAAWAVPAAGGLMAAAVAGVTAGGGGRTTSAVTPGVATASSGIGQAPTVSPE